MISELYINASCSIAQNRIIKDGKTFFEKNVEAPQEFLQAAYEHFGLNYPKFFKMDRLSRLGWLTAEVLLQDSFQKDKYAPGDTGLVLTNANSSLDADIKYYESTRSYASPALFVYTLPNIVMGEICIRHNFKGENDFFIFERFNADFLYQQVSYLLQKNILKACICGWVEILGNHYESVLYLVEKTKGAGGQLFTEETIKNTYQFANG